MISPKVKIKAEITAISIRTCNHLMENDPNKMGLIDTNSKTIDKLIRLFTTKMVESNLLGSLRSLAINRFFRSGLCAAACSVSLGSEKKATSEAETRAEPNNNDRSNTKRSEILTSAVMLTIPKYKTLKKISFN